MFEPVCFAWQTFAHAMRTRAGDVPGDLYAHIRREPGTYVPGPLLTALERATVRPARPDEAELLYQIYASTREEELAALPWAAYVKESFLRTQFGAQDRHFRTIFPKASYDLIVSGDEVLGLLYVDRGAQAWLVIHIALLPRHRGKGLGTRLLTEVLAEAAAAGKPVRLQVERFNQAQRLYGRLGFRQISDDGVYLLLECRPTMPADQGLRATPPYTLTSSGIGRGPSPSGRHSDTSTTPGGTSSRPVNARSAKSSESRNCSGTPDDR